MRKWKKLIIFFILLIGVLGTLVIVSGIVPVGASGGHWKITDTILHFAMERSIKLRSTAVEVKEFDQHWKVVKGAGHFEIGCRQCHGIPGAPDTNFFGELMTARAPYLPPLMEKWKPEDLFLIVKHGVKFTGMPHWPALERDDEVWSMVAFLKKMPGMSVSEYQKLVHVEADHKDKILLRCINCHGSDGLGRGAGAFPKLAGQHFEYMKRTLQEYKSGTRKSASMQLIASSLDQKKMEELSHYFQKQPIKQYQKKVTSEKQASIERGKRIAEKGIPEQGVAACVRCHGPQQAEADKNMQYPRLRGQYSEYLKLKLDQILSKRKSENKYEAIMRKAVGNMTEDQKLDVSNFYEAVTE